MNNSIDDEATVSVDFKISIGEFREDLSECIARVRYAGSAILLTRHGKPAAVLLSMAEYKKLKKPSAVARRPK